MMTVMETPPDTYIRTASGRYLHHKGNMWFMNEFNTST